jgi:hypothetical protein
VDGTSDSFAGVRQVAVSARGGSDTIVLAASFAASPGQLQVTINGGAGGTDALMVNGTADADWIAASLNSVMVSAIEGSSGGFMAYFDDIEKFTADAGAGDDALSLGDTSFGFFQQFIGGEGDDAFEVGDTIDPNFWGGNASLVGGAGQDEVTYFDMGSNGSDYSHNYRVAPFVLSRGPFNFEQSGFERVTLNTSNSADYIEVLHQPGTEMWVNAGRADAGGINPRTEKKEDVLWLSDTFNASNAVLTTTGPGFGDFTFPGSQFLPIHFSGVEVLQGADVTRPVASDPAFHALPRQEIELRFSEDVRASLISSDLNLVNVATGESVAPSFQLEFASPPGAPTVARWVPRFALRPGDYRATLAANAVQDRAGNGLGGPFDFAFTVPAATASVVGRHVFYNNSAFDNFNQTSDDDAIAPDKEALLPGQAPSFANVTSYSKGINGVIVDIAGLPRGWDRLPFGIVHFPCEVSDPAAPGGWAPAPPLAFTFRLGAGAGGSDRLSFSWDDGAIRDRWLRVTIAANPITALAAPEVFYFGNLAGDTGDGAAAPFRVNAVDLGGVKRELNRDSRPDGHFDFNRDGKVNALDLGIVKSNLNRTLPSPVASASAVAPARVTASTFADSATAVSPARLENVLGLVTSSDPATVLR